MVPDPFHPALARLVDRPNILHDLEHAVFNERITLCGLGATPAGLREIAVVTEVPKGKRTTCPTCWDRLVEKAILRSLQRLGGKANPAELLEDVPGAVNADIVMQGIHRLIGAHTLEVERVRDELQYQHAGVESSRCEICGKRRGIGSCSTCLIRNTRGIDQMDEWVLLVMDYLTAGKDAHEEDRLARRELLLSWARGATSDLAKVPLFGET